MSSLTQLLDLWEIKSTNTAICPKPRQSRTTQDDGRDHEQRAGRVSNGKICILALDLPLTSYIYLHTEPTIFVATALLFLNGCAVVTDVSFSLLWELTPTCTCRTFHLPVPPCASKCFHPQGKLTATPVPLVTVMAPGGHGIQTGLVRVMLRMFSGNSGGMLDSKLKFAAQEVTATLLIQGEPLQACFHQRQS